MSNLTNSVLGTVQSMVNKVVGHVYGDKTAAGNMPGGGANMKMASMPVKKNKPRVAELYTKPTPGETLEKAKQPVPELYLKPSPGEKGTVDPAKVAAKKANPKRPQPLKRKTQIRLSKAKWTALKAKRKEAAQKYKERSKSVKKEKVYRKNAVKRDMRKLAKLSKKQKRPEPKMNNCTVIYSVGPQPKYMSKSDQFRAYRKFMSTKLKCGKDQAKKESVMYMYKVGKPEAAKAK